MSFPNSFRAARWLRTTNLVLQALLFLSFFAGLNYLATQLDFGRFDLTRLRQHSLSEETRGYLDRLKQPVRVIVTLPEKSDDANLTQAFVDVSELLREYVYATETPTPTRPATARISVDYIDVYQRPADAAQYELQKDTVLFLSGDRRREVSLGELYKFKDKQREAFLGEQAFTAAILDVSSTEQKKIYFLTGHGEADPLSTTPRGLSELYANLRAKNYAINTIDLARAGKIPDQPGEKPDLIISAGATSRYEPFEQELLRKYLSENAGRLMVFVGPGLNPTGLEDLFYDWGLIADDVWIFDNSPGAQTDTGALILSGYWPHEITKLLIESNEFLAFGSARSIRPHPGAVPDPSRSVSKLVGASVTAWGERSYTRGPPQFSPGDLRGTKDNEIALVAAAERLAAKDNLPFSVPVGRLVAFGSADFINNANLFQRGNSILFISALNWLVDRDTQLSVPPRKIDKFQLSLSRQELVRLRYSLLFGLPAAAAFLGIIVYWTRRR
ncbi:ABC transporter [Nibricoccus aquaticus]|uniref:ABC transporter n=1 Tax=Nibricoccus aquaticus TaxID=2576891 RepID=A0A290QAB1_9BACT|nr:Gldg family protein [Nibricoccus aquaticus]ATC63176.1 ABC transporter [Nibricoccus aquaticus]